MVFVGIDWSETFHDVAVLDEEGRRLKSLRIPHGVEGLATLQRLLAEVTIEPTDVVVAVESTHGLLVNALVGSGYGVYPINPRVAARYRERDSVAGVKSDRRDADVLANLVRTDRGRHRPLSGDSEAAQEIRARARAHLRAVRTLIRLRNQLRSLLLEFYPAAAPLLAAEDLGDALAVLAVAPDPEQGQHVSLRQLEAALRRQGRQRNLARRAVEIQELLRAPHLDLGRPALVAAYRDEVASLVRMVRQARAEVRDLEAQLSRAFRGHPDAEIYRSFPGLADVLGGRVSGRGRRRSDPLSECYGTLPLCRQRPGHPRLRQTPRSPPAGGA